MDHFSYGLLTPVLAYTMSCIGSALGLLCTSRARSVPGASRGRWLVIAAIAIGGTGIWVMHFIAMLGFSVRATEIRYDIPTTIASALVAIVVVGIGLFIVGFGGNRIAPLLLGGLITGLGVASMHYLGMAAVNISGWKGYDSGLVILSVVIAVVAATAALWAALNIRGGWAVLVASLIMGVAVSGMHYTGMYAMEVHLEDHGQALAGADAFTFLLPLIVAISLITGGLLGAIALSPNEDELRAETAIMQRVAARRAQPESPNGSVKVNSRRATGESRDPDRPPSAFDRR